MSSEWTYGPMSGAADEERFRAIATQAFQFPQEGWPTYVERMGRENFRLLKRGEVIIAGLGVYPLGQWWGGKVVPMGGVAVVAVPPEERGSGAAFELMRRMLVEERRAGVPISTLYPATQRLYRKCGYEQAGAAFLWKTATAEIGSHGRELPVTHLPSDVTSGMEAVRRVRAARMNGVVEPSAAFWLRLLRPVTGPTELYVAGPIETPEGYIVLNLKDGFPKHEITVRDLVASTPRALRTLLTLLHDHRSMAKTVTWTGPANDPLQFLLAEQKVECTAAEHWMLRIVDVAAALEQRGYPEDAAHEMTLHVTDDLLPENSGSYLMRVRGGAARVIRSGAPAEAGIHVDPRGLAVLYSGLLDAHQLASLGTIRGDEGSLTAAQRLFFGREPWMPDFF